MTFNARIALVASIAASASVAAAQATFQGLGYLPIGFNSTVLGMSRNGQFVVGSIAPPNGVQTGFCWSPGSGYSTGSFGVAVWDASNAGDLVGQYDPDGTRQFNDGLYVPGGNFTLAKYVNGTYVVNGISSDGTVLAGPFFNPNFGVNNGTSMVSAPALKTIRGLPTPVDTFGPFNVRLNHDGSVLTGNYTGARNIGFRWTAATGVVQITDPNYNGINVNGLSDDGLVLVGWANTFAGSVAMRWRQSDGVQCLNALGAASTAYGVSGDGDVIVGEQVSFNGQSFVHSAILWFPTGQVPLANYLTSHGATGVGGWQLEAATAISSDGTKIAGYGIDPAGNRQGFYATITPPKFTDIPAISRLQLLPGPRVGGNDVACVVQIGAPAPSGGLHINMFDFDSSSNLTFGPPLFLSAGETTGVVICSTAGVSSPTAVHVAAYTGFLFRFATLTLLPADLRTPSLSPSSVTGGSSSQLNLLLNGKAPNGGGTAHLTSSNPAVASLPATASFGSFATSRAVTVSTSPVTSPTPVTITATYRGNRRQVVLTVNP